MQQMVDPHQDFLNCFSTPINRSPGGSLKNLVFSLPYFFIFSSFFPSIYRALVERRIEGLADLSWLNVSEMRKSLGPGYRAGMKLKYNTFCKN